MSAQEPSLVDMGNYEVLSDARTPECSIRLLRVSKGRAVNLHYHKDTVQIMAATNIPYAFAAVEGFHDDLLQKAAKAGWYARHAGMVYGKLLISCPLNWRSEDRLGTDIVQAAVNSCFFPLYEIERGKTRITYDPDEVGRRVPVAEWLGFMGKTRHLVRPEYATVLSEIEVEVDRRWQRLKAMHEHPLL